MRVRRWLAAVLAAAWVACMAMPRTIVALFRSEGVPSAPSFHVP
jgi:hypothetical protein